MSHDCFTPFPAVLRIVSARKNKKNVLMTESNDIQNKNDNPIEGDEMSFFCFFIFAFLVWI